MAFIGSMQFMNSSLGSLVKNLSNNDFKFSDELVFFKAKFSENKLPDKCKFFSSLKDERISEKDYSKTNNIWNVFKMNIMGDCHDLYFKTDVFLFADVFETFMNTFLYYYGLDPCHYFSSAGLSWDAMLKMTVIELELISDIDM